MATCRPRLQNRPVPSPDTRQLMRELRQDHRNLAVVLDLLQQCIDTAAGGENADFELIADIMRYMTVYPDAVHHPKEDVVYAKLAAQRPDLADGLGDVPGDHRDIAQLGLALRNDVEAIVAGEAVRREQFIGDADAFVTRLRNHMQWEEDDLFRRIDRMCDEQTVAVDLTGFDGVSDPLFEARISSGFERLLSAIQA